MKKIIGAVAVITMLAPMFASAASFSSIYFNNGFQTISTTPGSTVTGNVLMTVNANEAVQCIETIVDGLQPQYTQVGGTVGYQQSTMPFNVPFNVTVPQITGSYQLQVIPFGVSGAFNGQNLGCAGAQLGSATTFSNAVNVISNGGSTGSLGGAPSNIPAEVWAKFMAWFGSSNGTPTTSSACSALTTKLEGTMSGSRNDANVRLQGFLLSDGQSIPALAAGASFGFYGSQTSAAVSAYKVVHSCN